MTVANTLEATASALYGLVLAGGRGTRLGCDKGTLDYHGLPQCRIAAKAGGRLPGSARRRARIPTWPDSSSPPTCP